MGCLKYRCQRAGHWVTLTDRDTELHVAAFLRQSLATRSMLVVVPSQRQDD